MNPLEPFKLPVKDDRGLSQIYIYRPDHIWIKTMAERHNVKMTLVVAELVQYAKKANIKFINQQAEVDTLQARLNRYEAYCEKHKLPLIDFKKGSK